MYQTSENMYCAVIDRAWMLFIFHCAYNRRLSPSIRSLVLNFNVLHFNNYQLNVFKMHNVPL